MKITLLCENTTGYDGAETCQSEWGFSAFIEAKNTKILFDTGHTDIYLKNAKNLGINLEKTDFIILSHFHWDHTGGLRFHEFKSKKKIIGHSELFKKLPKDELKNIENGFEIVKSDKFLEVKKDIFYLGEIPRENDFEDKGNKEKKVVDDSAIAIKTEKGVVVITGCSHSGICNICEYAKKISGQNLYAVLGGFHLFKENKKVIDKTIEYFKREKVENLFPMHCVDFETQARFYKEFNSKKYSAGDIINLK